MIVNEEVVDLSTATGQMCTYIHKPVALGRYPGIVLFSEIFQRTEPIRRTAAMLAGHGFVVAVPEIFHELNPRGTVLPYDQAGADKGNKDKITKTIVSYDSDARAVIDHLSERADSTGKVGAIGMCIGGHLAFRAALDRRVQAAVCLYATDLHKASLGAGMKDDSLVRAAEIKGELLMIWGRQDPHIPTEGRKAIYNRLSEAELNFTWHEFNGAHAFVRDEGPRYDPALARTVFGLAFELFHRRLGQGEGSEGSVSVAAC